MAKRKTIDILLIVAVVALLVVCGFLVKPWVSADSIALIRPGQAQASTKAVGTTIVERCRSCNDGAFRHLGQHPGVAWVRADRKNNLMVVAFDSRSVTPDSITAGLAASGYSSSLAGVMDIKKYCGPRCNTSVNQLSHDTPCDGSCRTMKHTGERK